MAEIYHLKSQHDDEVIAFGPFRLDRAQRLLTKEGTPVPLGYRAFEILLVLIRHAPEAVSKTTLYEQVWPGRFTEEGTLRFQISSLRKALGDSDSRYITTASGKGYCFAAPLSRLPAVATGKADETSNQAAVTRVSETNLPLRLAEIIGREDDLAGLGELLRLNRLVTLVGPGGVGKTRLAVEQGWRVREDFAAGVWLIDVAPLTDQDAVTSAVATALGISVAKSETAISSIITALGKMRLLLIFDNCEHLIEGVAALVKPILERASGVSILATSQKDLQLAGEKIYRLDPLAVPPAGTVDIEGFAAVELFVERARAADRQFEMDGSNNAGIGEICRQLDGLPLALEMAAGRLRILGVDGLRRGLDDRLKLIKGARHDGRRHTSLHGMLEWSHGLLTRFDQQVFRRLAVFPSSFTLDAAVAVAGGDGIERWDVVDALGRLIDQSLVTLERREPARYRLLETLRFYAMDKLRGAGETDAIADLHARHFIEVFEEAENCWEATADPDWIARYQPEIDNLRAGLDWVLAAPQRRQSATALAAWGSLLFYALSLSWEGAAYLDRVLPYVDADTPDTATARLLHRAAMFLTKSRDPRGLALAERSVAIYRELGDGPRLAAALLIVFQYGMFQGRVEQVQGLLQEARHLLTDGGSTRLRLRLAMNSALASYYLQDIPNARFHFLEGLAMARSIRSREEVSALINLGVLEYVSGNIDGAIEFTRQSLAASHFMLGTNKGFSLSNLGEYLIAKGEFAEARVRLQEAFSELIERRNYDPILCLQLWAVLAGIEGHLAEAAQLMAFVDVERDRAGRVLEPAELPLRNRLIAILEAGLTPAELDAWKTKGAAWSEAEALAFVSARLIDDRTSENSAPKF